MTLAGKFVRILLINGYVINVESGEVKKGDILINGHKVEQISYEEGVLEADPLYLVRLI